MPASRGIPRSRCLTRWHRRCALAGPATAPDFSVSRDLHVEITDAAGQSDIKRLCADFRAGADAVMHADVASQTREILECVRVKGDEAVLDYTRQFDGFDAKSAAGLEVSKPRLHEALAAIPTDLRQAMETAAQRIAAYASRQTLTDWEYTDDAGMVLGQRVTALDRAGLYVPGGTAAYPSSVLMGAVPAKAAGVGEIIMTTPATGGQVRDEVLAAAALGGVDRVFLIGGAQAIAAMTWGTTTIPAVDKIFGPGNIWVAEAKRQVYGLVGIDMIAGPSEIVIAADASARPEWLAADLLAQAEHDTQARAILISCDRAVLEACAAQLEIQLGQLQRSDIARESMTRHGRLIHVSDLTGACDLINELAPEHLQLVVDDPDAMLAHIRHAGAIFIGNYTGEVFSDYCAGPNHVLPTMRSARFASPLGTYDFQKRSTVLRATRESVGAIMEPTCVLARAEGLTAHARAAELRAEVGAAETDNE
ncbi:MAG: histidinol dehydrogenase [Proteobacteria bacterium]|nr:histidinol dehydrogenase [Pseudomonadota bacterium]